MDKTQESIKLAQQFENEVKPLVESIQKGLITHVEFCMKQMDLITKYSYLLACVWLE